MMNRILILLLIMSLNGYGQQGYQISISLNAYKGQQLYLGYHYGKLKALADSAVADANGTVVFKGAKPLGGGIYFLVSPKKELLFEMLVDKQQHFSVTGDSSKLNEIRFKGSKDNEDFQTYTGFVQDRGKTIQQLQESLAKAANKSDSAAIENRIRELNKAIYQYRTEWIRQNPSSFLTTLFHALQEPEIPPANKHPRGVYDSTYAYHFFKEHYWDGISLADDRLLRTPFFENRLVRYYRELVPPVPDSIKLEVDRMLLEARPNKDMYKYLLNHFVQQYINPNYMGQDAVFLHLFEQYINNHPEVDWYNEKSLKYITDRAYSLMANQLGQAAWDLMMVDSTEKPSPLYEVKAPLVVICFWDPTCSHCKEMVPHLDSLYQQKWKKQGVKLYGVMTEGGKANWLKYIKDNNLKDWIHVYQTEQQREADYKAGKPSYRQLYDVYQTPVLYLLDEQKRIVAKKLSYQQLDELITRKLQQKSGTK